MRRLRARDRRHADDAGVDFLGDARWMRVWIAWTVDEAVTLLQSQLALASLD